MGGMNLLQALQNSNDLDLFENEGIKSLIDFCWDNGNFQYY